MRRAIPHGTARLTPFCVLNRPPFPQWKACIARTLRGGGSTFSASAASGAPILDTLDRMYRAQSVQAFMKSSCAYCLEHEAEIRAHIQKSEG